MKKYSKLVSQTRRRNPWWVKSGINGNLWQQCRREWSPSTKRVLCINTALYDLSCVKPHLKCIIFSSLPAVLGSNATKRLDATISLIMVNFLLVEQGNEYKMVCMCNNTSHVHVFWKIENVQNFMIQRGKMYFPSYFITKTLLKDWPLATPTPQPEYILYKSLKL